MEAANSILDRMTEYFDMKGSPIVRSASPKAIRSSTHPASPSRDSGRGGGDSDRAEVLWWSHPDKWDHLGDLGGLFMGIEEALE
jgi:hypothetical protein